MAYNAAYKKIRLKILKWHVYISLIHKFKSFHLVIIEIKKNCILTTMKSISCSSLFIALIVFVVLRNSAAISSKKNGIVVNKCCGMGKRLTAENYACINDDSDKWWPLIVLVKSKNQTYFKPKGAAPKFMKYHEQRPSCKKPEYYIGAEKLALFTNGFLYLSETDKSYEPNNYCIDRDIAIVCDPDVNSPDALIQTKQRSKIRKCCVKNEIYKLHENTCIPSNGTLNDEQFVLNSTQNDILFGFPDCKISKFFTIAERFKESSLDRNTNRLVLESKREVDWQNYCLEHVHDNASDSRLQLSVFTCVDHLYTSPQTVKFQLCIITFYSFFLQMYYLHKRMQSVGCLLLCWMQNTIHVWSVFIFL